MRETTRGILLLLPLCLNCFAQAVRTHAGGIRSDGHNGGQIEAPASICACCDAADKAFAALRTNTLTRLRLLLVHHAAKCRRWRGDGSRAGLLLLLLPHITFLLLQLPPLREKMDAN
jgi:hypothetical protein